MTNSNNAQNDRHRARGFRFFLAAALGLTNLAAGPAGFAAEFVPLGFFEGGEPNSFADDVSDDGAVVVGRASRNGGEPEAFRWTATTGLVALGVLPGSFPRSDAHAVSGDGSVVVGFANEAFRWTDATGMVGLGFPAPNQPSARSTADGISADGSIVVGQGTNDSGNQEAFRWTESGGFEGLGDLGGGNFSSGANG